MPSGATARVLHTGGLALAIAIAMAVGFASGPLQTSSVCGKLRIRYTGGVEGARRANRDGRACRLQRQDGRP